MDIDRAKAIDNIRVPLLLVLFFSFTSSASAILEITDFFSDYTSSEVTIRSSQDHHGKAVFQLLDGTNVVESQEVPFKASAGEEVSKVILWQNKRQTDRIITMRDGMIASDTGVKGNEELGL